MRKPVISSKIGPEFDGVPTTDILPYVNLLNNSCMLIVSQQNQCASNRPYIDI